MIKFVIGRIQILLRWRKFYDVTRDQVEPPCFRIARLDKEGGLTKYIDWSR